ncbi:MAG: M23 family metallopeptidase [Epsilonproteobacteria bacterium]|nr:M23 family metallopeptidase [Campylobacterota bacterium]
MKIFLWLFIPIFLFAVSVENGGVYPLEVSKDSVVKVDGKSIPLMRVKDKYVAFIAIPYKTKRKKICAKISTPKDKKEVCIHIKKGKYKKEFIKVANSKVHPDKKVLNRIYKEYKEAKKIYKTVNQKQYWDKPFILPLHSKITSAYGNARMFNHTLKSFHTGTDFRAKMKTPIKAINDGVVVIAKDRYYAGGSVVIDHGKGLYSCYYHLSKILVKKGQKVKRGEIVGLSGKSGRVSGPHLHFTIELYNNAVNPLEFVKRVNSIFD